MPNKPNKEDDKAKFRKLIEEQMKIFLEEGGEIIKLPNSQATAEIKEARKELKK